MGDMKKCFKCEVEKPTSEFYAHAQMGDGLLGKCKECTKSDTQSNYRKRRRYYKKYDQARELTPERKAWKREAQRKYRERNHDKFIARSRFKYALRTGKIKRQPCEVCGKRKSNGHHTDYSKPLDVRWLCWAHHMESHGKQAVK